MSTDHHRRARLQCPRDLRIVNLMKMNHLRSGREGLAKPRIDRSASIAQLRLVIQGHSLNVLGGLDLRREHKHAQAIASKQRGARLEVCTYAAISSPPRCHQ